VLVWTSIVGLGCEPGSSIRVAKSVGVPGGYLMWKTPEFTLNPARYAGLTAEREAEGASSGGRRLPVR